MTQIIKPHEIVIYYKQFLADRHSTGGPANSPTLDDFMKWLEENPVKINV
jgi:hypothetical protein